MDTNFLKKEARTERLNFALTAEEKQKIMELAKDLECRFFPFLLVLLFN